MMGKIACRCKTGAIVTAGEAAEGIDFSLVVRKFDSSGSDRIHDKGRDSVNPVRKEGFKPWLRF
jgi:hypothetical protein